MDDLKGQIDIYQWLESLEKDKPWLDRATNGEVFLKVFNSELSVQDNHITLVSLPDGTRLKVNTDWWERKFKNERE